MLNIINATLKDIDSQTKDLIREWRNQEFIRTMMFNQDIISKKNHDKWIDSLKSNSGKIVKVFFYNEIPMGVITFNKINNTFYEWGFYIGVQSAPKGMGSILGIAALDYYFAQVNSHKLFAEVLNYNEKSLAFHEKLGFTLEGVLRNHHKLKNNFHDVHLFGIFKDEWIDNRKSLLNHLKGENNE